jgi:hypothetical protein
MNTHRLLKNDWGVLASFHQVKIQQGLPAAYDYRQHRQNRDRSNTKAGKVILAAWGIFLIFRHLLIVRIQKGQVDRTEMEDWEEELVSESFWQVKTLLAFSYFWLRRLRSAKFKVSSLLRCHVSRYIKASSVNAAVIRMWVGRLWNNSLIFLLIQSITF